MERDGTAEFRLDPATVEDVLRSGRDRTASEDVRAILDRVREAEAVSLEDVAALWLADADEERLYEVALERRRRCPAPLETFSPLYLTNTCDAECRMCGMRRDNAALRRETASEDEVDDQLRTLQSRGMNAVALLTGEYRRERRAWAIARVNRALRRTGSLGFNHVLINVGSLDDGEMEALLEGIPRREDGSVVPKLTMCTFQETYSRPHYARFMGCSDENPRAHYDRRLANFDRAHAAGIRVANPGILVGLNPDLGFELIALVLHTRHLLAAGMEVYLSVPRLRQIAGSKQRRGATDAEFVRLVSLLSIAVPEGKIVLTTREPPAIQRKLVPIVTVLSAGSASVAPYTKTGARFPLETSQFEVIDQRPFEEILTEYRLRSGEIVNFRAPAPS